MLINQLRNYVLFSDLKDLEEKKSKTYSFLIIYFYGFEMLYECNTSLICFGSVIGKLFYYSLDKSVINFLLFKFVLVSSNTFMINFRMPSGIWVGFYQETNVNLEGQTQNMVK